MNDDIRRRQVQPDATRLEANQKQTAPRPTYVNRWIGAVRSRVSPVSNT